MSVVIRDAKHEDAVESCEVMRRSIVELCSADHKDDPEILSKWLANKTPGIFRIWIARPRNNLLVATRCERVVAVGAVTHDGEITLNYVSPDARFRGVSKALVAALEDKAAERGCTACKLSSTETAHRFYLACGYRETGRPNGRFGMDSGYPMSKSLKPGSE